MVESWEGEEGSTALQMVPGLEGYVAEELTLEAIMEGDEWMGITEVPTASSICSEEDHYHVLPDN